MLSAAPLCADSCTQDMKHTAVPHLSVDAVRISVGAAVLPPLTAAHCVADMRRCKILYSADDTKTVAAFLRKHKARVREPACPRRRRPAQTPVHTDPAPADAAAAAQVQPRGDVCAGAAGGAARCAPLSAPRADGL